MSEASEGRKTPPFGEMEDFSRGKYHEVRKSVSDPDVVIKIARTEWHPDFIPGKYPLNDVEAMKRDLDLLRESFGEFLPHTQLVVGSNEKSDPNVYVLQDRIEGEDLRHLNYNEEVAEQLRAFFHKFISFYLNNLRQTPEGWISVHPDIKGEHFIFGIDKKRRDSAPRLYFVDTYPLNKSTPAILLGKYLPKARDRFFPEQWQGFLNELRSEAEKKLAGITGS